MSAAQSRQLRRRPLRTDPETCTSPANKIATDLDKAIALFRKVLPDFGLKLVVPPPLPGGGLGRLSFSAWRRGEQSASVHSGASALEALQRLLDSEVQADRERRHRARCPLCRGVGWYIAANGIRAICSHPGVQA